MKLDQAKALQTKIEDAASALNAIVLEAAGLGLATEMTVLDRTMVGAADTPFVVVSAKIRPQDVEV